MGDFYVTLMSNAHSTNKIGNFKVQLPKPIVLSGDYVVALTSIIYPYTFQNFTDRYESEKFNRNTIWIELNDGKLCRITIPPCTYKDGQELVDILNYEIKLQLREATNSGLYDNATLFYFKSSSRRCDYLSHKAVRAVKLSKFIAYVLGHDEHISGDLVQGKHSVHTANDFLWIYTDIVEYQIVSNVMCPLLKVINIEGNPGQNVENIVTRPQYLNVRVSEFDKISILLKNDMNEVVDFHSGKVCICLHFRPK